MSFLTSVRKKVPTPQFVCATSHTKLVSEDAVENGVFVTKYSFEVVNHKDDPRNGIKYQDLCLSNLMRLGQLSNLKDCMLMRNDVDLVIDSLNSMQNAAAQVSAQDPQKGQN